MENTILKGDYLLGVQIHAKNRLPVFLTSFFKKPSKDEILIFSHPTNSYSLIKRVVAVAGDTISYRDKNLFINSSFVELPEFGQNGDKRDLIYRDNSPIMYIVPKKGDTIYCDSTNLMSFEYFYYIYKQQNPENDLKIKLSLNIDGRQYSDYKFVNIKYDNVDLKNITDCDWVKYYSLLNYIRLDQKAKEVFFTEKLIDKTLNIDVKKLILSDDCFFAMGDNRDYSNDSRFFGPVLYKNILTRPLIIYFSIDNKIDDGFFHRIRFNRIGNFLN